MISPVRTGAAAAVVTLTEAKAHLRVDHDDENTLITGLVAAATAAISEMTGLVLGAEEWLLQSSCPAWDLALPVAPVSEVTAISYLDADEVERAATVADFVLFADPRKPWLRPATGKAWPACAAREDALRVTVTAGLAALPPDLRVAILMLVAHWYQNRSAAVDADVRTVPMAVQMLIEPHRRLWVAA